MEAYRQQAEKNGVGLFGGEGLADRIYAASKAGEGSIIGNTGIGSFFGSD